MKLSYTELCYWLTIQEALLPKGTKFYTLDTMRHFPLVSEEDYHGLKNRCTFIVWENGDRNYQLMVPLCLDKSLEDNLIVLQSKIAEFKAGMEKVKNGTAA